MNQLQLIILVLTFIAGAAEAQWRSPQDPSHPSINRESLEQILEAHDVAAEDIERALAAWDALQRDYQAAHDRARLGYLRTSERRTQWQLENNAFESPDISHGLDFGSGAVTAQMLRDRFTAEQAFHHTLSALPSIAPNESLRAAILEPEVRRTVQTVRYFTFNASPEFRGLFFIGDIFDAVELRDTSRHALGPVRHRYIADLWPVVRDWHMQQALTSERYAGMRISRLDLGTPREQRVLEEMREFLRARSAILERFISINRSYQSQALAAISNDDDRQTLHEAFTAARYPECFQESPAHIVLRALNNHPGLDEELADAVARFSDDFHQQWEALRERLINASRQGESPAFLAQCLEIRILMYAYPESILPASIVIPEIIHPCEPLIFERDAMVRGTLRALSRLLPEPLQRRLDANVRLHLLWGALD